jgi:predicted aspartyl protease
MVDTGAETLVISEAMRLELGLEIEGERQVSLANEAVEVCTITEPIMVCWKERSSVTRALVLPGLTEVLLGAIPLEEMNLIVDPRNKQLIGAHGDEVILKIKWCK